MGPVVGLEMWEVPLFSIVQEARFSGRVPANDSEAWAMYPIHRWVYDRLELATITGLSSGPCGVDPPSAAYPIVVKPVMNLTSSVSDSTLVHGFNSYKDVCRQGFMWQEFSKECPERLNFAVVEGRVVWTAVATTGVEGDYGILPLWYELYTDSRPEVVKWIKLFLGTYTGCLQVDVRGSHVLSVSLRFTPLFSYFFGDEWKFRVVDLFRKGDWKAIGKTLDSGYMAPVYLKHNEDLNINVLVSEAKKISSSLGCMPFVFKDGLRARLDSRVGRGPVVVVMVAAKLLDTVKEAVSTFEGIKLPRKGYK
ncbi:MAG: hypothetical protein ACXABY_01490 [Candidatus Thorarchaeota archaeon]